MGMHASRYLPFSNWSLRPLCGEPAHGFFLRMVANEGHYSASVYGYEIGINGRRLTPEETLEALLAVPLPEESKHALRRSTPLADGAWYDLGGQRLRQRQMSFSTRRFCRACLANSPHHRVWWDIVAFRSCPEHATAIEDVDESGQPIGWWWADIACDTSGRPLARSVRSLMERQTRTLEAFILERLSSAPRTLWPLLDAHSLFEAIDAVDFLGRWLGNEHSLSPPADTMEKLDVGMAALAGTRDDLVSAIRFWFLDRVPEYIRRQGKMTSMGWAFTSLLNAAWNYSEASIWTVLQQAASDAFEPIGRTGKRKFREAADFYAERALSNFADSIGVKLDALIPLARHVGVVRGLAQPWELSSADEGILRAAVAELVPTAEVSRILAVESWAWQSLVGSGKLVVFTNFALGRMYLRSDVERLLGNVVSMASQAAQGTTVSLRTYARKHALSIGEVVAIILEDRLVIVRENNTRPGLRAVRVLAHNRTKASVV